MEEEGPLLLFLQRKFRCQKVNVKSDWENGGVAPWRVSCSVHCACPSRALPPRPMSTAGTPPHQPPLWEYMADKLQQLLRMSSCYMLVQDHWVLDMTKRGTWASLCQHILGLPATRGQVDPAATLVFCDRELELGNPLLWGACNKRIVSTCLQPHLDTPRPGDTVSVPTCTCTCAAARA